MSWFSFRPYVSVAQRQAQAAKEIAKRTKKGDAVSPVKIAGRTIATTFWGQAWCKNLEGYSDFENRLPRGRTYVRNGSVIDLKIEKGRINALVSGSEIYKVQVDIAALPKLDWQKLKTECVGKIGTLIELLQGKLSKAVMEYVTDRTHGLFPKPREITLRCSCPDYAGMCKHVAATMYGVGHRLDSSPELLFVLRGVDHTELIEQAIPTAPAKSRKRSSTIAADDLGAIFGIEIETEPSKPASLPQAKPPKRVAPKRLAAAKKSPAKKPKKTSVPKKG